MKWCLIGTCLPLNNAIKNRNNIFYYSVKLTYVIFFVLILNTHKLLTVVLILALYGTDSDSYLIPDLPSDNDQHKLQQ